MSLRLHIVAVGKRVPAWVDAGFSEYARRLAGGTTLELREVTAVTRGAKADVPRVLEVEAERLRRALPDDCLRVALDERGSAWSTRELAERLAMWRGRHARVAFLIGGADGLSPAILNEAQERWSLSRLTLPHALVRVMVAEQLYRAWTILNNHPYHRE